MERLWAPWRLKYILTTDNKSNDCVFCVRPEHDDFDKKILYRGKHAFVIMNIFPYSNGHIMVSPYRHTCDFINLTDDEKFEIMDLMTRWAAVLKEVTRCDGMNIGANIGHAAGAGIKDHIHFHIVPRWYGDVNFMPVIGDVKVIPESIDDCYCSLKKKYYEMHPEEAKDQK